MIRRIIAVLLIVLGLGTIGAAIGSATIWKPAEQVTLGLPKAPTSPYVITAPGVLSAVNDDVKVTVTAADKTTPVVLVMGREADVTAWLGTSPHGEITGLTDWDTLSYQEVEGEANTTAADPRGSDLWIEQVEGDGTVTYSWSKVPGRWTMLVATDGTAPAPSVQLTWTRAVPTPFKVPGLVAGSVVAALGLLLLAFSLGRRKPAEAAAVASAVDGALTGAEAPADVDAAIAAAVAELRAANPDRELTRRELRETEAQVRARFEEAEPAADAEDLDVTRPAQGERSVQDWVAGASAAPAPEQQSHSAAELGLVPDAAVAPAPPAPAAAETEPAEGGRRWFRRKATESAEAAAQPEAPPTPAAEAPEIEMTRPTPWRATWGMGGGTHGGDDAETGVIEAVPAAPGQERVPTLRIEPYRPEADPDGATAEALEDTVHRSEVLEQTLRKEDVESLDDTVRKPLPEQEEER